MALEEVGARLTLRNRPEFTRETEHAARDIRKIGTAAKKTEAESHGAFRRIGGAFTGMAGKFVKYGGIAAVAGIGVVTAAMFEGVKGALSYQKIQAQTTAVLRSTHGAAKVTASGVDELAKSIEHNSVFTDEAIMKGENLLLTFTGLKNATGKGNDVFNQTTRIMADMAQALGEDTTSAAMQLGKALNDPIQGVTMLRRVGVSFTKDQIDLIKKVTATHGAMAGQKLMLKELSNEFGGSAKAAGQTFSGALTKTRHIAMDFLRDMMRPMLGPLSRGLSFLSSRALPHLEKGLQGVQHTVGVFFAALTGKAVAWKDFNGPMRKVYDLGIKAREGLHIVRDALHTLWTRAILPVVGVIRKDLIPAVLDLWHFLEPGLVRVLKVIAVALVGGVVAAFKILGPVIKDVTGFLKDHKTLVISLAIPILVLAGALKAVTLAQKAWTFATQVWTKVTKAAQMAQQLFNRVMAMNPYVRIALLIIAIGAAIIYAYKHSATFRRIVKEAFHAVHHAIQVVWNWVKSNWPLLLSILIGPIGLAIGWIVKHWDTVTKFFKGIPGELNKIGKSIQDAITWPFREGFKLIAGWWNDTVGKIHFTLPSWVPHFGGKGFQMPTIDVPKAHMGGVVTNAGLVNVQPSEEIITLPRGATVAPLREADRLTIPGGGHDGQPHVVQVVLDRKVVAEATYTHTRDKAARR